MIAVMLMSAIAAVLASVVFRTLNYTFRAISSTSARDELNQMKSVYFNRLNCTQTLAPLLSRQDFDDAQMCVTSLGGVANLSASYLVEPRDTDGSAIWNTMDPLTKEGQLGNYSWKAACFVETKQPSNQKRYCVVLHYSKPGFVEDQGGAPGGGPGAGPVSNTENRVDPLSGQQMSWKTLFSYPLCCEWESSGPSAPSAPSAPGGWSGSCATRTCNYRCNSGTVNYDYTCINGDTDCASFCATYARTFSCTCGGSYPVGQVDQAQAGCAITTQNFSCN